MANIEKHNPNALVTSELINDLRQIIDSARSHVAATANYEVTMMNWNIGNRINRDVLKDERAEYGQQIVSQVATQLQEEYGTKGFELRSIQRMMQFALDMRETFPDSTGFSYSNVKYMKQWYSFYNERVIKSQQVVGQIEEDGKSQQVVGQLDMPAVFGRVPWGQHIHIFTTCHSLDAS